MIATIALLAAALQAPPCLPVSGEMIRARDVVEAVPAFAALPADMSLGYAPVPGATRILRAKDLEQIARQAGATIEQHEDVCFEWRLRAPSNEEFRDAMQAALDHPDVEIEILETSSYPAPPGRITFPLSSLRRPPSGDAERPVQWRGYIRYGERRRFTVWARVRLSVETTRVVVTQPIKAGEPIRPEQVEVQSCRCFPLDDSFAGSLKEVVGYFSRRPLKSSALVPIGVLDRPLEVDRGDFVEVEVRNGAAVIQSAGRAETRGRRGETVLIRNEGSGKKFHARVVGPGRVALRLSEE